MLIDSTTFTELCAQLMHAIDALKCAAGAFAMQDHPREWQELVKLHGALGAIEDRLRAVVEAQPEKPRAEVH